MADTIVDALILDLLDWLGRGERTYEEAIEAWRTSCPKLTVWEDASDRKLIATEHADGRELVRITSAGFDFLERQKTSRRPECPRHLTPSAPRDFNR